MDEAQRLTLQSNPLRFGRYLERNQDPQQEHAGSFHKLPSDFYLYRPFKMVADLTYDHKTILTPGTSIVLSLVDYQDPEALVSRDVPNLVDGSFHQTAARGFGGYGEDMYLAVPSHNPDPRIRLPIPGEYVVGGQRVFEKRIKRKTLEILYELGLYDSEAPIILHGVVSRGDFSQVQIVVSNTGTEDFALSDMGKLTFTVEQFHSMPKRGGPYNMTMLQNYYLHAITVSPSGTSDEEDNHSDNNEAMETA